MTFVKFLEKCNAAENFQSFDTLTPIFQLVVIKRITNQNKTKQFFSADWRRMWHKKNRMISDYCIRKWMFHD